MPRNETSTNSPHRLRLARTLAWIGSLGGIAITLIAYFHLQKLVALEVDRAVGQQLHIAKSALEQRMHVYTEALNGVRALFYVDGDGKVLAAQAFKRYMHRLDLLRRYAGFQAITFTRHVSADSKHTVLQHLGDRVWPLGERHDYYVVEYVEPADSNEPRLGYDQGSEPERRAALERARDSGRMSVTASVALTPDPGHPAGFLLVIPVYANDSVPSTVEGRRKAFRGAVTAVFRNDALLKGVFADFLINRFEFHLFDRGLSTEKAPANGFLFSQLIYDSHGGAANQGEKHLVPTATSRSVPLDIGDRRWELVATPLYEVRHSQAALPPTILAGGITISLLLFGLLQLLAKSQEQVTSRLKSIADAMTDVIWSVSLPDRRLLYVSPSIERVFGQTVGELYSDPRQWSATRIVPEDRSSYAQAWRRITRENASTAAAEYRVQTPAGVVWVRDKLQVIRDTKGRPTRVDGVAIEITAEKRAEEERARVMALIESSPDFIAIATPDDRRQYLNRAAREVLGLAPTDPPESHPLRSAYAPWALRQSNEVARPTANRDGLWRGESALIASDGTEIPVSQVLVAHKDRRGQVEYYSTILRDISETKRRNAELHTLQRAIEQNPAVMFITDPQGNVKYVNPSFTRLTGYNSEEVAGKHVELFQTELQEVQERLAEHVIPGNTWSGEMQARKRNGELLWVYAVVAPVHDPSGQIVNYVVIQEDVTARKASRSWREMLHSVTRILSENEPVDVALPHVLEVICGALGWQYGARWLWDARGSRLRCAQYWHESRLHAVGELLKVQEVAPSKDPEGLVHRAWLRLAPACVEDLREDYTLQRRAPALAAGLLGALAVPVLAGDKAIGVLEFFYSHAGPPEPGLLNVLEAIGRQVGGFCQRKEAEEALLVARSALYSAAEGILILDALDPEHCVVSVNPALQRITGYSEAQIVGRPAESLLQDVKQSGIQALRDALDGQREARATVSGLHKDGRIVWMDVSLAPVRCDQRTVSHYVAVVEDITERVRYEQQLEHHANFDSLTGLPNRNLLMDRINQALARARRDGTLAAVLLLDLDQFKLVNDSLGHDAGDWLLHAVAERLQRAVREVDTVARWGGDEFVVVVDGIQDEQAVTQVCKALLTAVDKGITVLEHELTVTASIGASVFPHDGVSAEILIRNADMAMYRSKAMGRNAYQFFTNSMAAASASALSIRAALRGALERSEFHLVYQPQFSMPGRQLIGWEALLRWTHPTKGAVPPGEFIPVAEECGLIVPIGQWVLEEACRQQALWKQSGVSIVPVGVNLSALSFKQADLVQKLSETLRRHGVPPNNIEIEVTEGALMGSTDTTIALLHELRALGVALSIDDFGTGFSSLSYLKRLPIGRLKIDRSFVSGLPSHESDVAITGAIIGMARSLRLQVIAEGVETEEQAAFLAAHGCLKMQGYLLGRPMKPSDIGTDIFKTVAPI